MLNGRFLDSVFDNIFNLAGKGNAVMNSLTLALPVQNTKVSSQKCSNFGEWRKKAGKMEFRNRA
jgi:hypothetical protein